MPASEAWKAFCRNCSLPAISSSDDAVFMPVTASSVSTRSSTSPITSAAPCCLPEVKCVACGVMAIIPGQSWRELRSWIVRETSMRRLPSFGVTLLPA